MKKLLFQRTSRPPTSETSSRAASLALVVLIVKLSVIVAFQLAFVKVRCKLVTLYAFNHIERVVCLIDSLWDHI